MKISARTVLSILWVVGVIGLTGCSHIKIQNPSKEEKYIVKRPYDLRVQHTGCGHVKPETFRAWLDKGTGTEKDISNSFSYSNETWSALNYNLPVGSHTFTAAASVNAGGWCYVGRGGDTREFEVHCTVGAFSITTSSPAYPPQDFLVSGNLAYVTTRSIGMKVWDISNPSNPDRLGNILLSVPNELTVAGGFAYVEDQTVLRIINVSDPSAPLEIGHVTVGFADDIEISGGIAYIVTDTVLRLVDVDPPQAPRLLGMFSPARREARAVAVTGKIAYFVNVDDLFILDVSDPMHPTEISRFDAGRPIDVEVANGIAYVTDESGNSLHIIDVSNSVAPVELGSISTQDVRYGDIEVVGTLAYIATDTDSVRVIDVSNPAVPVDLGPINHFSTGDLDAGRGTYDIEVVDDRLYIRTSRSVRIIQLPCLE